MAALPSYRKRTIRGRSPVGVVTLTDSKTGKRRDYYLGDYGTPASRQKYARIIAEWEGAGRRLPDLDEQPDGMTLTMLVHAYWRTVVTERAKWDVNAHKHALRAARKLYGRTPAADFGPNALRKVRQALANQGLAHNTVVNHINRITGMFRWAAAHELLPITVYQRLRALEPLRRGTAKPSRKVTPVSLPQIEATRERLTSVTRAMVDVQRASGMRSGEMLMMRPCDLDMTGDVWVYRPASHKTEHHGHERVIFLGPRAQEALRPLLMNRPTSAYIFSPAEATAEHRAAKHAARKSYLSSGNRPGTNRKAHPQRKPGEFYTPCAYRRAIIRACDAAGVECWHPHQLRHLAATEIRREHGLEAARVLLGHSSALVTDAVYAERDYGLAKEIAKTIG